MYNIFYTHRPNSRSILCTSLPMGLIPVHASSSKIYWYNFSPVGFQMMCAQISKISCSASTHTGTHKRKKRRRNGMWENENVPGNNVEVAMLNHNGWTECTQKRRFSQIFAFSMMMGEKKFNELRINSIWCVWVWAGVSDLHPPWQKNVARKAVERKKHASVWHLLVRQHPLRYPLSP